MSKKILRLWGNRNTRIDIGDHTNVIIHLTKGDSQNLGIQSTTLILRDSILNRMEEKGESLSAEYHKRAGSQAAFNMALKAGERIHFFEFYGEGKVAPQACLTLEAISDDGEWIELSFTGADIENILVNGKKLEPLFVAGETTMGEPDDPVPLIGTHYE